MKLSKIIVSSIVAISILVLSTGCITIKTDNGEYQPVISSAQMASEIDETTYDVLEQTDVFKTDSPKIFVVAQLSGSAANKTIVKAKWVFIDKEYFIGEAEAVAGYREGPIQFSISKPDSGWPTGKYQVTLFADGKEMVVKFFEVE